MEPLGLPEFSTVLIPIAVLLLIFTIYSYNKKPKQKEDKKDKKEQKTDVKTLRMVRYDHVNRLRQNNHNGVKQNQWRKR